MNKAVIATIVSTAVVAAAVLLTINSINRYEVVTEGTAYGFTVHDRKEKCFQTLLSNAEKNNYDYIFRVPSGADAISRMNTTIENVMENSGSLKGDTKIPDQNKFRIEINEQNRDQIMNSHSWKIMIKSNLFINQLQLYFSDDTLVKIERTREMFESP